MYYNFVMFETCYIIVVIFLKTEQVMTKAEEQFLKLENKRLKAEELLNTSKQEVQSLNDIILKMEKRMESLKKNEISQKNTISQLTNMLEEEQNNQQDMLIEVSVMLVSCNWLFQ